MWACTLLARWEKQQRETSSAAVEPRTTTGEDEKVLGISDSCSRHFFSATFPPSPLSVDSSP